ncbi:MAG: hypothetical protein V3R66_05225, partial [Rhodospirillales bacterium]
FFSDQGGYVMSKARARQRAKARAAAKGKKPQAKPARQENTKRPARFEAEAGAMRRPSSANVKNLAGMKRGAARSR